MDPAFSERIIYCCMANYKYTTLRISSMLGKKYTRIFPLLKSFKRKLHDE